MISLAWGGFKNGSVPDSVTAPVDAAGHRLERTAAANWLAMRQACFDATGKWISVAPGAGSAGRTIAQQEAFWAVYQAGGNTAAVPGTSNHGWWRAVDITGYETTLSGWVLGKYVNVGSVWRWLMANMARFGFSWDTGRASRESWHFESVAAPGTTPAGGSSTPLPPVVVPITEDRDMQLVYDKNAPQNIYLVAPGHDNLLVGHGKPGEPDDIDVLRRLIQGAPDAQGYTFPELQRIKAFMLGLAPTIPAASIDTAAISKSISAAVIAALPTSAPGTEAAVAAAVDAALADNFAAIPTAAENAAAARAAIVK